MYPSSYSFVRSDCPVRIGPETENPWSDQRPGKTFAFRLVYSVCRHVDELDAVVDSEDVVRHLQIDSSRHGFQQRVEFRLYLVDIRRVVTEDETLYRNRLWCQCFSVQRVGIAAVDHQLTIVEQGQYAVELLVRIGLAAFVASYDIALMNLDGCEILGDAAVQG